MSNLLSVEEALANYKDQLKIEKKEGSNFIFVTKTYDATPQGKKDWYAINKIVETELNGEWVSQGRDSHWKIPVTSIQQPAEPKPHLVRLPCPNCGKGFDLDLRLKEAS